MEIVSPSPLIIIVSCAAVIWLLVRAHYYLTADPDAIWERWRRSYEQRGLLKFRPNNWKAHVRRDGVILLIIGIGLFGFVIWLWFTTYR